MNGIVRLESLPFASSTWGRRGGLQRVQTPGPAQVAVQWWHSPPSGPHGSTPQRTPSSSWQSPPGSSPPLAVLHLLLKTGLWRKWGVYDIFQPKHPLIALASIFHNGNQIVIYWKFPSVRQVHWSAVRGQPTDGQTATSSGKPWLPMTPNDGLCAAMNG